MSHTEFGSLFLVHAQKTAHIITKDTDAETIKSDISCEDLDDSEDADLSKLKSDSGIFSRFYFILMS